MFAVYEEGTGPDSEEIIVTTLEQGNQYTVSQSIIVFSFHR